MRALLALIFLLGANAVAQADNLIATDQPSWVARPASQSVTSTYGGNTAYSGQWGSENQSTIYQDGAGNTARILQNGNSNTATLTQHGNSDLSVTQNGGAGITVTQTGTPGHVSITQTLPGR